jgi:hypothetical protein
MKHAQDLDGEFFFRQKENAVVADAKAELVTRRLEFFHVAHTGSEITVDGSQNAQCSLAVNGAEISASFWRPEDSFFGMGGGLAG